MSTRPSRSGGRTTTSAIDSIQGIWFEWCSMCVTNTTGLCASGTCR